MSQHALGEALVTAALLGAVHESRLHSSWQSHGPVALPHPSRVTAPALIATAPADAAPASSAAVRPWVVAAGYDVGMRNRLPTHVIDAYVAAHR
ncbi:Lsr2 family DNA-binding protein [Curtobacterium poinsettiae]|uniref:Lsr2 family DNA-binding protein n=1 Tax=Curtobacterium poinsettiae TaxID=159612 RepID=UPI001BDF404E|nr:Lsr2 family protein [Curtobacterium flaccumfaciens pv. poinsettiae]